jgi:hypothetical protein
MLTIFLLALSVPGLVCVYAFLLRPLLHSIPALAKFYAEADGFWGKVWALCGKSVTMLWGYAVGAIGSVLQLLDPLSTALGDPGLKDQVTSALQANPKALGWFAIAVSIITISARIRSLGKA